MFRKYWYHCTAVFWETPVNSITCLMLVLPRSTSEPQTLLSGGAFPRGTSLSSAAASTEHNCRGFTITPCLFSGSWYSDIRSFATYVVHKHSEQHIFEWSESKFYIFLLANDRDHIQIISNSVTMSLIIFTVTDQQWPGRPQARLIPKRHDLTIFSIAECWRHHSSQPYKFKQ